MAQVHAYRLPDGQVVLDLQTDLIDTGSRVVAPLVPASEGVMPLTRLEPEFGIDGTRYVLHTAEMAAIAELTSEDHAIRGALDMVFSDF